QAIPARKTAEAFGRFLQENYGGDPARMAAEPTAKLRGELLGLKGIGIETADAILLLVLGHPVFAIDVHSYRVFTRHALAAEESGYEELQEIAGSLPADADRYREFHGLLGRVGREFCRAEAKCEGCPLNGVNW
ncbi:MAG TPA: endonuclease III domain-containing protein, partial [bacterium]|nr:endonuclease III domain-containing protein [bacterium]